jgi:hypothetical protein
MNQTQSPQSQQPTQPLQSSSQQATQSCTSQAGGGVDPNASRTRCEVWTRVMGYHRPVSNFNTGKKSEHYSRKHFVQCISSNQAFAAQYA